MSKAKRKAPEPPKEPKKDLVVLAADKDAQQAILALLGQRQASLRIRQVAADVIVHNQHDPGCLNASAGLLQAYLRTHAHALVVFDREGCGRDQNPRGELEKLVESDLHKAGWQERAAAVVIDPELENWLWADSPHVASALHWAGQDLGLRAWLVQQGFLQSEQEVKPARPKEARDAVLKQVRLPASAALYKKLAESVSLEKCVDPAFRKLVDTLRRWFPAESS